MAAYPLVWQQTFGPQFRQPSLALVPDDFCIRREVRRRMHEGSSRDDPAIDETLRANRGIPLGSRRILAHGRHLAKDRASRQCCHDVAAYDHLDLSVLEDIHLVPVATLVEDHLPILKDLIRGELAQHFDKHRAAAFEHRDALQAVHLEQRPPLPQLRPRALEADLLLILLLGRGPLRAVRAGNPRGRRADPGLCRNPPWRSGLVHITLVLPFRGGWPL
mmetsp:Transcript_85022/g.274821  ORF Transcript_85022/g.274821 Transcript_85022/m.274821 type:complete len:219 (+) Transcript_85022:1262-1918(+)